MRRRFGVVLLLIAVAASAYWVGRRTANPEAPTAPPVNPETEIAATGVVRLTGVVRSANPVDVLPDTSGVVQSLHVRKGDQVKEGDLLAIVRNEAFDAVEQRLAREYESLEIRVENLEKSLAQTRFQVTQLRSEVQESESKLRLLEEEAERQRLLFAEGATARQRYLQSQADLENAQTQHNALLQVLRTAETQLSSLEQSLGIDRYALMDKLAEWEAAKGDVGLGEVFAPFDGVVTEIRVVEGVETGPNAEPMMEIAPLEAVRYAVVQPDEAQMRRIRVGQPAFVRPESLSDVRELPATVYGFRGSEVLVEFIDEANRLAPGSTVRVEIDATGDELI
jgi:multidrug resistance efflux pump